MLTKVSYSQDGSDTNSVGTPDYPSGIPDMHTIHDPVISASWIHISELITELHHPLQYRIVYLQLVTWPSMILPRRASLQLSNGYQAALMSHTTRNLLTRDPPYWSLDGHRVSFTTFLWPKTFGCQWSVTNGLYDQVFGVGHRRLWPK
jgi:hypothetical protein